MSAGGGDTGGLTSRFGRAGDVLGFAGGVVPGTLNFLQQEQRRRTLRELGGAESRAASLAGSRAARTATARGLTGGQAAAFQSGQQQRVANQFALQRADLQQQAFSQDIQGLAAIAQLAGALATGNPVAGASGGSSLLDLLSGNTPIQFDQQAAQTGQPQQPATGQQAGTLSTPAQQGRGGPQLETNVPRTADGQPDFGLGQPGQLAQGRQIADTSDAELLAFVQPILTDLLRFS
jgi:hypothetical protein